ncbi:MAG: DUF882 domain-containing protein [Gammaproteobacteria bacterium]|nr:DUF882 domain-containing protein [Gammaproteobacteria bacterium]MDH3468258.1 DUF882 domain-containing protein [Gammaproteobacteria bacterium]
MNRSLISSRRLFLTQATAAVFGLQFAAPVAAATNSAMPRTLAFENLHTGERLRATYWSRGHYEDSALEELAYVLRDHRTGDVKRLDSRLFDVLHLLQSKLGFRDAYQVISGYRSPKTNEMLLNSGRGVVKNSFHTRGQAVDVRVAGLPLTSLRDTAKRLRRGGVGYYPKNQFIHIDVGRVRFW